MRLDGVEADRYTVIAADVGYLRDSLPTGFQVGPVARLTPSWFRFRTVQRATNVRDDHAFESWTPVVRRRKN